MDLIIKNGSLVDSVGVYRANLAINKGKIEAIYSNPDRFSAEKTIDAEGKYIFPGVVDSHVHFQLQDLGKEISTDSFASGTQAAAFGGCTTIIDFADQTRGASPLKGFLERQKVANSQVAIDYGLHVSKTDLEFLDEIIALINEGVSSFKFFTTYSWRNLDLHDSELIKFFSVIRKNRALAMGHLENDSIVQQGIQQMIDEGKLDPIHHAESRPHIAEEEAIQKALLFVQKTKAKLHIAHITTKEGSDLLRTAKQQDMRVTGETCPHYLLLNEKAYMAEDGYLNLMSPPLRYAKDQQALVNRIKDGTIDLIVTDHCEFSRKSKGNGNLPFYKVLNGIPGIETSLPLMYDLLINKYKMDITKLITLMSTNPAKLFGLYPQKGSLQVNTDADLVIFDPSIEKTIRPEILHHNIDWNPYSGMKVKGWPIATILRGQILCENGEFIGPKKAGKFLARQLTYQ